MSLSIAQPVKPLRAFLPVNTKAEKVRVVNDDGSVYVIKSSVSTTELQVIRFDSLLQEVWGIGLQRSLPNLSLVKTDGHRLFLLMMTPSGKELDVLELEKETGNYFLSRYTFSRAFTLKDFIAYREHMWCSGWINEEGVAFKLDPATGGVKTLPIGYQQPIGEVANMHFDRERKVLHLSLRTKGRKQVIFVHRLLDLESRIVESTVFESPGGYNLKDFRMVYAEGQSPFAAGPIFKGNPDQLQGVTTWRVEEGSWVGEDHLWRDIPGFGQRIQIDGGEQQVDVRKGKWTNGVTSMGDLMPHEQGIVFAIDQFQKQYNVRGALQRQFDQQQLVNQLDQDQFGRRGFDANETSIADRVNDFSNTDFSTYQFRELIVGNVDEAGIDYARSYIFSMTQQGELSVQAIEKHPDAYGRMSDGTPPLQVSEGKPLYLSSFADRLDWVLLDNDPLTIQSLGMPMGPYSQPWGSGRLLNFGFLALDQVIYLYLQRCDLAVSASGNPVSSGH